MIKYLMRKTIYKDADLEAQDMLLKLIAPYHLIEYFCLMLWIDILFIMPILPLVVVGTLEDWNFSLITKIVMMAFMFVYCINFLVCINFFRKAMFGFSLLLSEKIYFSISTKKGKAVSKEDFDTVKNVNEKLYECIATQSCQGYCYSICFELCKALQKGSIEFIAMKNFTIDKTHGEEGKKPYTMHVLYINNGWAFDTYSIRQYPVEKLHEIYKAKIYKSFDYDSIRYSMYEDFRDRQEPELAKWCEDQDCSQFWKEKETA